MTWRPRILASWMEMEPTPPAPAWISTRCPSLNPASSRACHAVSATRGSDAASSKLREAGMRARAASGSATWLV